MRTPLDHALAYMERGWSVIPLQPGTKFPALSSWKQYQTEKATEARIILWWNENPNYNVGIVTGAVSGLLVVDIDPGHGGKADGFPDTTMVVGTGGGGTHLYYQIPEEGYGSYTGPNGIDMRCKGGYVVAPPSIHESGESYVWDPDEELGTIDIDTLVRLAPRKRKDTADQLKLKEKDKSGKITEGGRNDRIARDAGYCASQGMKVEDALNRAHGINQKTFDPPLSKAEVEKTVRSIYRTDDRNNPERHAELENLDDDDDDCDDKDFELIDYEDFILEYGGQEIQWQIPGYVVAKTICIIHGAPGSLKTWIELDMAVSLASGLPFLGDENAVPERPGTVIIIQQEDALTGIANRLATIHMAKLGIVCPYVEDGIFHAEFPTKKLPIKLYKDRQFRFDDKRCVRNLAKAIKKYRPVAVFFDPLYSLIPLDDNMSGAVEYMQCLKLLKDRFGTSFFLIHHSSKGSLGTAGRQGMLGNQFINAFPETVIKMSKLTLDSRASVMTRTSKETEPSEPIRIDFDIFDASSDEPGEWRYNTTRTEITEAEMFKLINPEAKPDDDESKPRKRVRKVQDGLSSEQSKIIELASRSSGLTKFEITRDSIDPHIVVDLISNRHLTVDSLTGVIYKRKTA